MEINPSFMRVFQRYKGWFFYGSAALAAVFLWGMVFHFYLIEKSSFFDDAFIYLKIARNVLDTGTAQYYPVSGNQGLLASSPLRLVLLIPSMAAARILHDPADLLGIARLTFALSGLFTCAFFLPWFRRAPGLWLVGFLFAGLLSLSTETALQMEGLLLFWSVYTLIIQMRKLPGFAPVETIAFIRAMFHRAPAQGGAAAAGSQAGWKGAYASLGCLAGFLLLSRFEYGLAFAALFTGLLLAKRLFLPLVFFWAAAAGVGLAWGCISLALHVWPVPITYLGKVMTGELGMFGANFMLSFPQNFMYYFSYLKSIGFFVTISGLSVLLFLTGSRRWYLALVGLMLGVVFLTLMEGPGNFRWYYENFIVVALTILMGFLLERPAWDGRVFWPAVLVASVAFLLIFFAGSVGVDRNFPWNFHRPGSRAYAYMNVANRHLGNGLFRFEGRPPTYLQMVEIGIVSYFSDETVWIFDKGGLAQTGNLQTTRLYSLLSRLYPPYVLRDGMDELRLLCGADPREDQQRCNAGLLWAWTSTDAPNFGLYYNAQEGILLVDPDWQVVNH